MSAEPTVDELLSTLKQKNGQIQVLDTDRDEMVRAARRAGASWARIGQALGGISRQSAWERYRHLDTEAAS